MGLDFRSNITLQSNRKLLQNGGIYKSLKEIVSFQSMYPLSGGIDCTSITDTDILNGTTLNIDYLTAVGRYYCPSNGFITKIVGSNGLEIVGDNLIFEIIVSDRIGGVEAQQETPPEVTWLYYMQTIRVYTNNGDAGVFGNTTIDWCRIEYKRHMTYSGDIKAWTYGELQTCILPNVITHDDGGPTVTLPSLLINSGTGGNVDLRNGTIHLNGGIYSSELDNQKTNLIDQVKTNKTSTETNTSNISKLSSRLDSLGFNKGGKITVSINNGTGVDLGHIYKIGDVFYGKTFATHFNKENRRITTITITITLPEGITQNDVKSLMIFPPQIIPTSKNTGGKYNRVISRYTTTMTQTSYIFEDLGSYVPDNTFVTDVELSECTILGTTNINHALPTEYSSGGGSSGNGGRTLPNFDTVVELA